MTWWHRLWRRDTMETELEKEVRFHLDQYAADLVRRGIDPDQARRQARLALGGPEQVKEQCRDVRGTRWLEDLLQDVHYALRMIRQMPGFTTVALLMLALGIGATTVMFTVINGVLLRPLSYPEPDRLVSVHGFTEESGEHWGFSNLDFADVKRESRSLAIAAWIYGGGTISEPGEPEYVDGRQISAELFSVLGLQVLHGRAFRPEEDRPGTAPVAIISHGLWRRRYGGNAAAVGETLVFDGKPHTVIGIAPPGFQLLGEADVFTPLGQNIEPRMQNREARFVHVVARLRPGVVSAEVQAELALIGRHLGDDQSSVRDQMYYPFAQVPAALLHFFSSVMSIAVRTRIPPLNVVEPLRRELRGAAGDQALYEVRTMEQLVSASLGRQRLLVLLFGIFAGAALLLACVGIYGVLAYLTNQRVPELGVRIALGATARDIKRLVLRQSVTMIVVGVSVGACGAWATGRLLERLVDGMHPAQPATLAIMPCILVAAAVLASFVPARRASRLDAMRALRQE